MATTLFTFLGRAPRGGCGDKPTVYGYRKVVYRFPDATSTQPLAFLGWDLVSRQKPDRLVILGTTGSMWDHLLEGDFDLGPEGDDARMSLLEAMEADAVNAGHLDALSPFLAARLGCEVCLVLIPYCQNEVEQTQLLAVIAEQVGSGDSVELDVTHGFRHLPMLGLLAALYLRRVKKANVEGIWYGAFDPESGEALVHKLDGLLRIADWLEALAVYDRSGDYGVFGPLAGPSGRMLEQAAFYERTTNTALAKQSLSSWAAEAEPLPLDRPEARLFSEALHERLRWWRLPDRAARESALARRYFDEGDYLRAAIFGQEAVITAEVARAGRRLDDFDARDEARRLLNKHEASFKTLGHLRNALAHGSRANDERIRRMLAGPDTLAAALGTLFQELLEEE